MPFTGRLGTQNSKLGNIVLGIADSFDAGTFGFDAHVLTSSQIRVRFDHAVTEETALVTSSYIITSLAPPLTAIVPTILRVTFYNEDRKSVVLYLDRALTFNTSYSLQMIAILDDNGETVSGAAKNFDANVQDPPRILGAYLSERGYVDVLFDRSVGPTSVATTADIRGASGGPGVAMTLFPWTSSLPETTIRFEIPVATPLDSAYFIDVVNVVDLSLNTNDETTELDLVLRAPTPYSYATFIQAQIIDAYVADVSNDLLNVATVRVYFNFNIDYTQSKDTTNWSVSINSGHRNTDTFDVVTSPDAVDLATLITLINELKDVINAHEVGAEIHYQDDTFNEITTPDAFDSPSAQALTSAVQTAFLSHLLQHNVHLYPDTINYYAGLPVTDLATAITAANQVKASYTDHIQASYPTTFSTAYSTGTPIGEISPFASVLTPVAQNIAFDTGAYNYFVDLHVDCPTNLASINITVTVQSEDAGSVTNPGDYTGSITARAVSSTVQALTEAVFTDQFMNVQFDREISVEGAPIVNDLVAGNHIYGRPVRSATLAGLVWTVNDLLFAYATHIDPVNGAGHATPDTINTLVSGNYITHIDISEVITAANLLKLRLNDHMASPTFHYNVDSVTVTAPYASDLPSLVVLTQNLRDVFLHHNSSGSGPNGSLVPSFPGVHLYPGYRIFSARLFNILEVDIDNMLDGASYQLRTKLLSFYHDNALNLDVLHDFNLSQDFPGIAKRPSLASALPIIGFNPVDSEHRLNYDAVQVFFSKPMFKETLTPINLSLTGGSILVKDSSWTSDTTVSMRVVNMTIISYSLQAVGLKDVAGNVIY